MKLPDSSGKLVNVNTSIHDCEAACLSNCSCLAYAIMELSTGGYGCIMWFQKLVDIRILPDNGQDIYVRLAASELGIISEPYICFFSPLEVFGYCELK